MKYLSCVLVTASLTAILSIWDGMAWSYVTDGGGGYCLGCGVPPELEADAKALRELFNDDRVENLLDQQILGSLCDKQTCGELTEEQAGRLLDRWLDSRQEFRQWWSAFWSWIVAGLGLAIAAGGLWISVIALRQSNRNEREIGQIQGQLDHSEGEPQ